YIGDDLPDIPFIKKVGLGVAVANARPEVLSVAHWRTQAKGGKGAVRELCDFMLSAQGKSEIALERYLGTTHG
ncbi:MAG: HAD hydrolase family protein, partial [Legionellaceae bacterium]|nr:HAD hydrolase family protein [Legionellaceae bacterium]